MKNEFCRLMRPCGQGSSHGLGDMIIAVGFEEGWGLTEFGVWTLLREKSRGPLSLWNCVRSGVFWGECLNCLIDLL